MNGVLHDFVRRFLWDVLYFQSAMPKQNITYSSKMSRPTSYLALICGITTSTEERYVQISYI
jgi:hypothetical protein